MKPLFSICIPSYKHPELLERALQSIITQDYKNIEVIISDDTPGDSVKIIADTYRSQLQLKYYQNTPSLGTPENWNAALDKANGELMMLLHHDDWLASETIISECVTIFVDSQQTDVVFGRSMAVDKIEGKNTPFSDKYFKKIYDRPIRLLLNNIIGPPSNLIIRRTVKERYNVYYKWLVDLEFYIQLILAGHRFTYIDKPLIFVGIHAGQMTNYCKEDGYIIVKENVHFANDYITRLQNRWKIYDHYWRLLRNNKIRSINDLLQIGLIEEDIPSYIRKIIKAQSKLPAFMLKSAFSKISMSTCFLLR